MSPLRALSLLRELRSLPEVVLRVSGGDESRRLYEFFTKRHPRYKLIQNKRWGVGLLPLPDSFEAYMRGRSRQVPRTNRRRAENSGFHFAVINPLDHLDEILAINRSTPARQGKPVLAMYLDGESLREFFVGAGDIYGVFNREGVLRAYAHAPIAGDVFVFSEIFGHQDDLNEGIMYLLVSEVIREMIVRKGCCGNPSWAMYDTFFGAQPGLRYFKERLGFSPYKVNWIWDGPS